MAITENYPDLKANQNFQGLMKELAGTESGLAFARKGYNESVQLYNATIRSLPASLFARFFGFCPKEYFQADGGAKHIPQVGF